MDDTSGNRGDQPDDRVGCGDDAVDDEIEVAEGSLTDSLAALIEDGKTYAEAEIAFQKSRAAFAFDRSKGGAIFVLAAVALLHLALIALVVGLLIGVSILVGPWWGTAIVVGTLLILVGLFGLLARSKFRDLSSAFKDKDT